MSDTDPPSDIATAMAHDLVSRDFRLMEKWDDGEASEIIGPTMYNDESVVEPPAPPARHRWGSRHLRLVALRLLRSAMDGPPRRRRG
jgi:hypothetical protein